MFQTHDTLLKDFDMENINFTKGNWENHFEYAYTKRFPFKPRFIQEEDCIVNGTNPEMTDGFDYTTIMTKKLYGAGTKIWFVSSFEEYGAPLITLTDKLARDSYGDLSYGECYEVILWENGINIWNLYEEDGVVKPKKLMASAFNLEPGKKHELYLELMDKSIRVVVGDKDCLLRIDNLPERVYIGITGCENINRLYNVKIDSV